VASIFHFFSTKKAQERLTDLEERVKELERHKKSLEMEWELAYDKLHKMLGRLSKRTEMMHENAETEGRLHPNAADSENAIIATTPTWSKLSPRQKQIQMQVLQRRRMNGGAQ
jgi:hypothetical protein